MHFFLVQCAALLIASIWAFAFTLGMLWVVDRITPVRVSEETEQMGLDQGLGGESAYL
jgi:Amt family ammonium transporter